MNILVENIYIWLTELRMTKCRCSKILWEQKKPEEKCKCDTS